MLELGGRQLHQHGPAVQAGDDIHAVHEPVLRQVELDDGADRFEIIGVGRYQGVEPPEALRWINLAETELPELLPAGAERHQTR